MPKRAAAPSFTPSGGTYSGTQSVQMATPTYGATIRYTTDGTTPTNYSAIYTGPVSVSATQTLKAIATNMNMVNSSVTSGVYTIGTVAPTPAPAPAPTVVGTPTFFDDFSNGLGKWQVSNWGAPGSSTTNKGSFITANAVVINGMLCLKLWQGKNADGTFTSIGGEVATLEKFGYGTYEFVMKASSSAGDPNLAGNPVSGSITGLFSYSPGSVTEIDVEMEGSATRMPLTQLTTWTSDTSPNEHTEFGPAVAGEFPHTGFHTYKWVWAPGKIEFWRDGVLLSTHTKVVPTQASPVIINHWGTNQATWGGVATPGVERYMWIKSFSFTAA